MNLTVTSSPEACDCHSCDAPKPSARPEALKRALGLEYLTVGWNIVEGIVAVTAAVMAGSVAIFGFGIDSFVECASAGVLIWRLRAERNGKLTAAEVEHVERRALKYVAGSLVLLAAFVTFEAVQTLWAREKPEFSPVGVMLLALSIAVMLWLARAKRRLAQELGSKALEADAFQTTACWWLSIAALAGVGLNGLLGWWWADPMAALVIAVLIVREGREAWKGEACC